MTWQTITNRLQKPLSKIILFVLASAFLLINFCTFSLSGGKESTVGVESFSNFQEYSEALVYGKIIADQDGKHENYNAGLYAVSDNEHDWLLASNLKNRLSDSDARSELKVSAYLSQTGLQGYIASFLHNKFNIPISILRVICAFLLACVLMGILFILSKEYGFLVSVVSFFCMLLSPWICAFSKKSLLG